MFIPKNMMHFSISNLAPHDIVNSSNMKLTSSPWHLLVEMYVLPMKEFVIVSRCEFHDGINSNKWQVICDKQDHVNNECLKLT